MKTVLLILTLSVTYHFASSQVRMTAPQEPVKDGVCPNISSTYEVTVPDGLGNCSIEWEISSQNGIFLSSRLGRTVRVQWNDGNPNSAELTAKFTCPGGSTSAASISQTIVTLFDKQTELSTPYSYTFSPCNGPTRNNPITLSAFQMFVDGLNSVPLEARYSWTLPAGWQETSGGTGNFVTTRNAIQVFATGCNVAGQISVQAIILPTLCNTSNARPATITISQPATLPNGLDIIAPNGFSGASQACNTTPVTFTAIPSKAIEPSCGFNYSWEFPSGWRVDTQTNNSIRLIPSGSAADAGAIRATLNFSCGAVKSPNYNISFTASTIAGPNLVCVSETYNIQNAFGNSFTWQSSNTAGLVFDNPNIGIARRVNDYNGPITITAFCGGAQIAQRSIWAGRPGADNSTLIWTGVRGVNPVTINAGSINQYQCDFIPSADSYTWVVPRGFRISGPSSTTSSPFVSIITGNQNGTYTILCRGNNNCGWSWTRSLTVNVVNSGGGGGIQMRVPFPNPANDNVTVKIKDEPSEEEATLALINKNFEKVYVTQTKEKEVTIPTSGLPEGVYYLDVVLGKEKTQRQLIIKH